MRRSKTLKTHLLTCALGLLLGHVSAQSQQGIGVKVRPQGDTLTRIVQTLLAELSTPAVPFTLDSSAGPTLTIGGVGVSAAPFNPDSAARVVEVSGERRLEFNPSGPLSLTDAVKAALMRELGLKEWTAANAQLRFGGADLNGDGQIDLADLAILMENVGRNTTTGDLNQDRKVDAADLRLFQAQYAKYLEGLDVLPKPPAPAAAPATPTPASQPDQTQPEQSKPASPTPATPTVPPTEQKPAEQKAPEQTPAKPSETPPSTPAAPTSP